MLSCKHTRYVGENEYLLSKNEVKVNKQKQITASDIESVVKPKENKRLLGMRIKLAFYNSVDTNRVNRARIRKKKRHFRINERRILKTNKSNDKRIIRALKKGKKDYIKKYPRLRDTVNIRKTFIDWWQNTLGEPPVIYDTAARSKSINQIKIYLEKKGFFYSKVTDTVEFDEKKRSAKVIYRILTGKPYVIDSIAISSPNISLKNDFEKYFEKKAILKTGSILDAEAMDDQRSRIAAYLRDEAYYGFSASHIYYKVDTNKVKMTASVELGIKQRKFQDENYGDSVFIKPHQTFKIRNVFFHISDTMKYDGNFIARSNSIYGVADKGRDRNGYFYNFDTLVTEKGTYYFNGKPTVKEELLELQNFLEINGVDGETHFYRERYVSRSYGRLMELGVFSNVKPVLEEVGMTNLLDVHYYLVPAKKQSFSFEPRGTHSNGFLGLSASLNYRNKNLFRRAVELHVSLSGGFESQPPVFSTSADGSSVAESQRSFNTFDFGPKVSLDLPGLFPFPARLLSKRQTPHTVISMLYNYQKRTDFVRHLIQLDYSWKWKSDKSQTFMSSLLNPVKFSFIDPSDDFQQKLDDLNDLFIRNAYSSQFTWEDIRVSHTYDNQKVKLQEGKKNFFYNHFAVNHAGGMASLVTLNQVPDSNNQKKLFKVPFAEFVKVENETKYYQNFSKKQSLNYRLHLGIGVPYGNSSAAMPFDYSFFAGGSNDNRGFVARTLGPGAYKYYIDTDGTSTQIGDIKIALNLEYRVALTDLFKLGLFVDAGNIWTLREDINRPGGKFSKDFYKELALSAGLGLRLDLSFFIIRVDLGIPLYNPSFPKGEQWIWDNDRPQWHQELESTYGDNWGATIGSQFVPRFNIGIGYPF